MSAKRKPTKIRTLHAKAWKLFSEYIRRRGADWRDNVSCFTCGKQDHWKNMHAGHFKHGKLDFDTMNVNPQCPGCNTYRGGKLDVYALRLIDHYGLKKVRELERRANQEIKLTVGDLEAIIENYKSLLKSL